MPRPVFAGAGSTDLVLTAGLCALGLVCELQFLAVAPLVLQRARERAWPPWQPAVGMESPGSAVVRILPGV